MPALFGCAAQFDFNQDDHHNANSALSANPVGVLPAIIGCDPANEQSTTRVSNGLTGHYFFLDAAQPRYTLSGDYSANGHEGTADIFTSQINFPTHEYVTGLSLDGANPLKDDGGVPLTEYFGVVLNSRLKLGANDKPGTYQLGLIADDGSSLYVQNFGDSTSHLMVDNDGRHSAKFGCANTVMSMNANTRIPMTLSYYQGPRSKIALVLMWRPVQIDSSQPNNGLNDAACGKSGDDFFFTQSSAADQPVPTANFLGMLMRGWQVLAPDNFEIQAQVKSCGPR